MQEKLHEFMKERGLKPSRLAEMLGINPAAVSHILSGRNKPSFELLQKILRRFPDLNPDWLLLDQGSMLRPDPKASPSAAASAAPTTSEQQPSAEQTHDAAERSDARQESIAMPQPIGTTARRIVRVVLFFDDQTFVSYPTENNRS